LRSEGRDVTFYLIALHDAGPVFDHLARHDELPSAK
jgi:hypothetical protein